MKYIVEDIIKIIEQFAPLSLQESWDNSGLSVGTLQQEVSMALLTVDITEAVVKEAIDCGAQIVISHHPVTLSGFRKMTGATDAERAVIAAIRGGVALYSAHTNMDVAQYGVSYRMAMKLGLKDVHPLAPHSDGVTGLGVVGLLPEPMSEMAWLKFVCEVFNAQTMRYTPLRDRSVRKVALCGGSGSSLLNDAVNSGADAYVTADFKYHQFADAAPNILVADIGHFESEQFTKEIFYELLSEKIPTFAVRFSKVNTNPINCL